MALTLARVLLPLLAVSMVTRAAPVAEEKTGEEVAVAADGDRNTVGIEKRAKEEIVFGNQQNSARLGAAKRFSDVQEQPLVPENPQPAPGEVPAEEQAKADEPEQSPAAADLPEEAEQPEAGKDSKQADSAADPQGSGEEPSVSGDQPTSEEAQEPQPPSDQSESTEAQDSKDSGEVPAQQQDSQEAAKEEDPQPVPVEGGEHEVGEKEQQLDNNDLPLVPVEEGGVHSTSEGSNGNVEEAEDDEAPEASETTAEETSGDNQVQDTGNSPDPGSEEALQALTQPQDMAEDDVENLLKDLHNDVQMEESSGQDNDGAKAAEGLEGDEGSAERELMQVTNQIEDGNGAGRQYTQSLLKYILSHGDEYGRLPPTNGYLYPTDPYYLQRRRRSLAASRLPHIHRRLQDTDSEKELSRAKRTKRDLFDDNLYYNLDTGYNPLEEEEEEEEEEKDAELQELLTYLLALYPALYDKQLQNPPFPGYLWQGPSYPEVVEEEEEEGEEPYWAEPSAYEEPRVEWEEPELETPAWEPSFYPEEVEEEEEEEEPDFYPVMAKRQMMSFVPGQRRKRYFFPFAREPYTHWGAFVPSQKREYYEEDPYRRLKELALVLAEDRQPAYFDALGE